MARTTKRKAPPVTCHACGATAASSTESRRYSQLINAVLVGVQVLRCPSCGEEEMILPRLGQLHDLLAKSIAGKSARLQPGEIRWLRTHLGYSSADFARLMGVEPETVSRWERADAPARMSMSAERLLRLMALQERPIQDYALEKTAIEGGGDELIRVGAQGDHWEREERVSRRKHEVD